MNIDLYTYSGRGGRPVNEDSLICGEGYYVVSDGLGGHDNGEVASSAAVNCISENFRRDISAEAAAGLLAGADDAVRRLGNGGKATVAAVFTNGDKIRISNVGDSRVYYFRRGSIFFRTRDHSVCQASVDMGEMTDDDVRHSADRSGLLKVLGDAEPLKLPKPYDLIDPVDGDAFLICSDGFWEHIYDPEMEADLLKSANAREWLEHMLKRLLLRSGNSGDNYTAVCGIISAPERLPQTAAIAEDRSADIPRTMELGGASGAAARKRRTIIGIAVFAAIAAMGVITALLVYTNLKSAEDISVGSSNGSGAIADWLSKYASEVPFNSDESSEPDESSGQDISSEPDTSSEPDESSGQDISSEPDESSGQDISSEPDESSGQDISSEPDTSSEPDESSTPDQPSEPDESSTPKEPSVPFLPHIPIFPR